MGTVNGPIFPHIVADETFQRDALASNEPVLLDWTPTAKAWLLRCTPAAECRVAFAEMQILVLLSRFPKMMMDLNQSPAASGASLVSSLLFLVF